MRHETVMKPEADILSQLSPMPTAFLNCYAISPRSTLAWRVSTYVVTRVDGQAQTHQDRSPTKNALWTLRKQYPERCQGYGFVVDVNERLIAVPATWDLPSPSEVDGYRVTWERTLHDQRKRGPGSTNHSWHHPRSGEERSLLESISNHVAARGVTVEERQRRLFAE